MMAEISFFLGEILFTSGCAHAYLVSTGLILITFGLSILLRSKYLVFVISCRSHPCIHWARETFHCPRREHPLWCEHYSLGRFQRGFVRHRLIHIQRPEEENRKRLFIQVAKPTSQLLRRGDCHWLSVSVTAILFRVIMTKSTCFDGRALTRFKKSVLLDLWIHSLPTLPSILKHCWVWVFPFLNHILIRKNKKTKVVGFDFIACLCLNSA